MSICARNFSLGEFAQSKSYPHLVQPVPDTYLGNIYRLAIDLLQPLRALSDNPMTITSGYRSAALNVAVGGSRTSQHLRGEAADFTSPVLTLIFTSLVGGEWSVPCGQCIYYPSRNFVHLALPSPRYPMPSYHVHEPSRGLSYRRVRNLDEFTGLSLPQAFDA